LHSHPLKYSLVLWSYFKPVRAIKNNLLGVLKLSYSEFGA
jgi:hypothetical protein